MKILIIKLASIGDVLASSPVFSSLNQKYVVDHLVDKNCKFITANSIYINKIITLDDTANSSFIKNFLQAFKLVLLLQSNKYDVVFNFHRSPILTLILFLSGIKKRFGFTNKLSYLYTNHLAYKYDTINRTIQEYDLVRLFDENIQYPNRLEYFINSDCDISKFNLPNKYIVCNPGGGVNNHSEMKNRRWINTYYDNVIDCLNLPVILVGSGSVDEEIGRVIKSNNCINLIGQTTFDETALILKNANLYFGNDSSILFLAASQNIPTLGIFGPTQSTAANPIGSKQYYIDSSIECAPCYNPYDGIKGTAYTCQDNQCMKSITSAMVLTKINEILKKENKK